MSLQKPVKSIVIIGPAHPLRGGLASFNERLAIEFKHQDYYCRIFTFSLQYPGFLFPGTTQYSSEAAPKDININVSINSVNPFNWIKIGNHLKQEKPDIILVRFWLPFMGPCLGTILRRVKKNKHTKVVCLADNILPHEKRPGDKVFTSYFLTPVDAFITMSKKVLADLQLFGINKPAKYVSHPLYDNFGEKIPKQAAREMLQLSATEPLILFFGFIRYYKGLDILLDALKILKSGGYTPAIGGLKLLVAGEFYEDATRYLGQIKRLGIEQDVILKTAFIPDSEVKYFLSAADLIVQPYRHATQSGVTPLAYHFEIPMIVTNVGALPDMVPADKVGLIAEPNAESIANKIVEFFQKGEAHFIPWIKEEKKKYDWKELVQEIVNI